ncbi:hypothetical protein LZ30DRAFT_722790 [Colletotrichum cereale]|nr:hypothetical protein LZ30DRAFT_722790 [Colletotrichum cereale]
MLDLLVSISCSSWAVSYLSRCASGLCSGTEWTGYLPFHVSVSSQSRRRIKRPIHRTPQPHSTCNRTGPPTRESYTHTYTDTHTHDIG